MKRRLFLLLACIFLFVFTAAMSDTELSEEDRNNIREKYSGMEHIENMIINMKINKDGTITVNEEINYFFPSRYKHGIYRNIPVSYPGGSKADISIKMNYVTRNGINEKYKTEYKKGMINFKIGNAATYVSGMNKYILNYTVYGAVTKKEENRYEIDWNAVGQSWTCDILDSEVNIFFEDNEKIFTKGTNLEIYTGTSGEKGKDYRYTIEPDIIKISATEILERGNGLTVFLYFQTDKIHPDFLKKLEGLMYSSRLLSFSAIFLLSFLVFALLRLLTLKKEPKIDKDTYGKIPNELSPMFLSSLRNEKKIENIISIGIFSLISKKHMKMCPEISDDAFELLDSFEKLTEEETALKNILKSQKFGQRDIETIVEDKIDNILKKSELNLDRENLDKLKKILEDEGKSRKINKFSSIPEESFYAFQNNLIKMLTDKKIKMIEKDNFGYVFIIIIIGLIMFGGYEIGYMITNDIGGGIGIGINIGIWTNVGLAMYILGNPSKRLWIYGVTIGILLFIATQNIFILVIWCIFGYVYNKYINLKRRHTEYGACINYEVENIATSVNNYKSDVENIFTSEEMTKYIDKIYPYAAAVDLAFGMEKLMDRINMNNYVAHDEINNNFRNTYRHSSVRKHISKSYSGALSHHSASSDSGSGGSHSSGGHSSGGGHGGGGGGSW